MQYFFQLTNYNFSNNYTCISWS